MKLDAGYDRYSYPEDVNETVGQNNRESDIVAKQKFFTAKENGLTY